MLQGDRHTDMMNRQQFSLRSMFVAITAACIILTILLVSRSQYLTWKHRQAVQSVLVQLDQRLKIYFRDLGELPTTDQGLQALTAPPDGLPDPKAWRGPYGPLNERPWDAWGHLIQYERVDADHFYVYSLGPDGVPQTADDLGITGTREESSTRADSLRPTD